MVYNPVNVTVAEHSNMDEQLKRRPAEFCLQLGSARKQQTCGSLSEAVAREEQVVGPDALVTAVS